MKAGGKLQEGEEGLRPGGPQIPPGSLDSVGGGGGGRGLSVQRLGDGGAGQGGRPGPWQLAQQAPYRGGGGLGQGPVLGLGQPAMGQTGSHSLWCLSLLSLLSLALSPFQTWPIFQLSLPSPQGA